jgi:ABC-type nitrate/sulfonate/bicarbonate transport system permease component
MPTRLKAFLTSKAGILALCLTAVMFVVWQVAHAVAGTNAAGDPMVPGIVDVAGAFHGLAREWPGGLGVERTDLGGQETWPAAILSFGYHSGATGLRMITGYLLGVSVGLGFAALVSWSATLRRMVHLPAHGARMLPVLAMIPLFGLWFGMSNTGAILYVGFSVFVYTFAFGINAIANVPQHFSNASRSLGAGRIRTYVEVVLPAASPEFGSGLALSLALAWSAAISAEFNGQQSGLGQIAYTAKYFSRTGLLALIAITVVAYAAVSFLAARAALAWLTRWAE